MTPAMTLAIPETVAVLAFDGIGLLHLSAPCVTFGDTYSGGPCFDFSVCAEQPGVLRTSGGLSLVVEHDLTRLAAADVIIAPSWPDPAQPPSPALTAVLREGRRRGALLVGLCLGAYPLAYAGLLEGRVAATHWAYAEDFARRFPEVRLNADVLYVEEDGVVTSGGAAAALDCCLYLLSRRYGAEAANRLARRLVIPPHRSGGQAQFIERPAPTTPGESRLAALLDWVRAHLDQPHTLDRLAAEAGLSRRSFTRSFRRLTGASPAAWLLAERLAQAQRLLETTDYSIEDIAAAVGFGAAVSLRMRFKSAFGVAPGAWRRSFSARR